MAEQIHFPASEHSRTITDPCFESVLTSRRAEIDGKCQILGKAIEKCVVAGGESPALVAELHFLFDLCGVLSRNLEELHIGPDCLDSNLKLRAIQQTGDTLSETPTEGFPLHITTTVAGLVADVTAFLKIAWTAPLADGLFTPKELRLEIRNRVANPPTPGPGPSNAEIMEAIKKHGVPDRPSLVVASEVLGVDLPTVAEVWLEKNPDGTWQDLVKHTGKSKSTLYSKTGPWAKVRSKLLSSDKAATGSVQPGFMSADDDGAHSVDGVVFENDADEQRYRHKQAHRKPSI